MALSCKFSVTASRKPTNTFYIWYAELCRRSNANPLSVVKPTKTTKNNTVLDFIADRIKPEEWTPIINALRLDTSLHVVAIRSRVAGCRFFYEVNTEDRLKRMKKRQGCLWTDYVLKSLLRSLGNCLKSNEVLSSLELDGLPISGEYFEILLQSLQNNRTLKMLSLTHCPISDRGCQQLCYCLRQMPNIEILNLGSCNLSSVSGRYIATIIKHQQLNRYCESWHQSLRYEEPKVGKMAGIKRITLNNNPNMGDEGVTYILDELDDDLWIKALDMQKCGVTDNLSARIIDLAEYSKSLEIIDVRNNERLSFAAVERILQILHKKRQIGNDSEYQWCITTTTLCDFAASQSTLTGVTAMIHKSQSAPLRRNDSLRYAPKPPLRKVNTIALLDDRTRQNGFKPPDRKQLNEAKRQFSAALNSKLHIEISTKRELEIVNSKLENYQRLLQNMNYSECEASDKLCKAMVDLRLNGNRSVTTTNKQSTKKTDSKGGVCKSRSSEKAQASSKEVHSKMVIGKKTPKEKTSAKVVFSPTKKKPQKNEMAAAQTIFQKFLMKNGQNGHYVEDIEELDNEDGYFSTYNESCAEIDFQRCSNTQFLNSKQIPTTLQRNGTFVRDVIDEELQLRLDTSRSSDEETSPRSFEVDSPTRQAQTFFSKILLEAG